MSSRWLSIIWSAEVSVDDNNKGVKCPKMWIWEDVSALIEDLDPVPSTHRVAQTFLYL